MLEVHQVVVLYDLRVVRQVPHVLHTLPDHAPRLVHQLLPLLAGFGDEDFVQELDKLHFVFSANFHVVIPLVLQQVGAADSLAEVGPVAIALVHGKCDPLVILALVGVPQSVASGPAVLASGIVACQQGDAVLVAPQPHHASQVGNIDLLALPKPLASH